MQKIWSFFLWSTSPSQTRFPARSSAMFIHFPPQADTVNTSSLMIFRVWTDLWNLCRGRRAGPRSLPRDQDITNTFFYCESQQQSGSIHRPSQQTVTGYRLSGGTNMDWLLSIVSSSLLIAPIISSPPSSSYTVRLPFAGSALLKTLVVIHIFQFRGQNTMFDWVLTMTIEQLHDFLNIYLANLTCSFIIRFVTLLMYKQYSFLGTKITKIT